MDSYFELVFADGKRQRIDVGSEESAKATAKAVATATGGRTPKLYRVREIDVNAAPKTRGSTSED